MIAKPTYEELENRVKELERETFDRKLVEERIARKEAEEALGKSEERYRNLVENSLNAIILYRQKEILFANEPFFHIFGYERGELQGMVVDDLLAPEVADGVAALRRRRLGGKIEKAAVYESKGIRSNGKIFDMEISVCVIPYQGEQCCMAFLSDISNRKEADQALAESEDKYRSLVEESFDGIFIQKGQTILFANKRLNEMLGYEEGALTGQDHWVVYHPDSQALTKGRAQARLRGDEVLRRYEVKLQRKDGSWFYGEINARPITFPSEKERGIQVWIKDIDERKRAEAEHERLLLAIEQANEIVVITDASGTIQYVNPAFEKITGYSNREAIGKNPRLFKSGHHNGSFYKDLWETILAGNPWTGRLLNKRKNGALYTGESSISPVKDENGNVMNFVWISHDITKELELEKRVSQAQKMEAIGALAGGIAHDFNNLLFPIMGLSEMLMEDLPSGTLHYENAKDIFNAARRAGDLVNQILSFSRQSDHKKTPVMIQHILREVTKLARATIPSNIEIAQGIQNDCGLVMADPTQIHQIAMNLITNAYHAVEQDGGKILIKLTEIELKDDNLTGMMLKPGRYALMTISDTGHGIDPAIIGKIFEPYFTTKAQGKGTGLGLSVVYKIVTEHGGDILVSSEVDKGTTFSVYLPIMKEMALSLTPDTEMVCKTGTEKILLVDDDAAIVRLEKQVLESLGYMVEAQTSSMEALHMFRARPDDFDVVISDMTMPNLTGDQLAEELISIKPSIPVIICTGFSNKMNKKRAAEIGVKGLLMKPITKSEIAHTLRKVLDDAKNSSQE